MTWATILVWVAISPLLVAAAVFLAEALAGLLPYTPPQIDELSPPTTIILMPAHDEAGTLGTYLDALKPALGDPFHLIVVADNCTDRTADIARSKGIEVVARVDPERKGKGFALAFGRDYIRDKAADCVIILDADCFIDRQSLTILAKTSVGANRAVQARCFLCPDLSAAAKVQVSNFAFWFKNVVRQRGSQRLFGPAILNGTGMAFPREMFDTLPLASPEIVEDLALCLHLTRSGSAPRYLDASVVESVAASETATLQQRTRWEHGFLAIAQAAALPALRDGVRTGNRALVQLGLHLLVPPLALLSLLMAIAIILLASFAIVTSYWLPLAVITSLGGLIAVTVGLAWAGGGWRWLSPKALMLLPFYVAWKIQVYFGFLRNRQMAWVRTSRSVHFDNPP